MDELNECYDIQNNSKYKHERTIIHVDLDCFYAQVEIFKNPNLSTKPVGIKQQHYLITSNYVAREFGIRKCMTITEALALCPKLIIINGEDLHDYRVMSTKVTEVIRQFSNKVEKLGFDENFVDVTEIVSKRLNCNTKGFEKAVDGYVYMDRIENNCTCGCKERLTLGSHVASEIRERIRDELGMTCCAGIAHNKLLAKLVCPTHKPNQQTTLFPCSATTLVSNLSCVRAIPGIGRKTSDVLEVLGISTMNEVQNASVKLLEKHLGKTLACWIKGACFGIDDTEVKVSGKQQVIGLEEACKKISSMEDVENRFNSLIDRGMILLKEDGRYPNTIRVSVRKYCRNEYLRQRESKQCTINPSLLRTDLAKEHILEAALSLFKKLVDHKQPFHLTLIGLAFTKFQEEIPVKSSLLQFLKPKSKESQSETLSNDVQSEFNIYDEQTKLSFFESQVKSSNYRKSALEGLDESVIKELPEDIRAEVLDSYSQLTNQPCTSTSVTSRCSVECPPGVDSDVFNNLPHDIQMELIREAYGANSKKAVKNNTPTFKQKSILNFLKK